MSRAASWLRRQRTPLVVFAVALAIYAACAGSRLRRRSTDPHFGAQAAAWLQGRVDIPEWPAGADDPAKVETVRLDDGSVVQGRRIQSRHTFRRFGGEELPQARIRESLGTRHFMSFPSFPSVLMLPQALLHGARANDVALTVLLAALVPALLVGLLRRLRELGLSTRTAREDLWLVALLAVGSVFWYSAVQGRVWFTAHIVGVLLATLYAWASLEAAHPVWAGVFLGCAVLTRTPMLFMAPFFLFEAWRAHRRPRAVTAAPPSTAALLRRLAAFAAPVALLGLAAALYNYVRFGELAEFGHSYLAVRQQEQIEAHGLFSPAYLGRNLSVALTLLPSFSARFPYVTLSGHGLALWLTTPVLVLLLWPRERGPLHRSLWVTVAFVAAWSLLYQNTGWVQFGYRFALDYLVFLVLLLAVGGQPLGRAAKSLILLGILVNLFGAVTFHRFNFFYRTDAQTYGCVVKN